MSWKKRDNSRTIQEVIRRNTGDDLTPLLSPKRDPFLYHLQEMADFVKSHLHAPINVVADYDVDGVCSATILKLMIENLGGQPNIIIPHRFSEGYGFSEKILARLCEGSILTVDNGIAARKTIEKAKALGYDCAVIDHHLAPDDGILPDCLILDPHVEDHSEYKEYCGAGLAYRLAKVLIDDEELLEKCLIFASMATVADVMTLLGDNRNIVKEGLAALNDGKGTLGLRMLVKVIVDEWKIQKDSYQLSKSILEQTYVPPFTEEDYGYKFGPIINASGRLHDDGAELPYSLFILDEGDSEEDMFKKSCEMWRNNEDRKAKVAEQLVTAHALVPEGDKKSICIYSDSFDLGIVGILAGKLAEEYRVPAIVFGQASDPSVIKGSGRSAGDIHLKNTLDGLKDDLLGYGGHAGAAGLSMKKENLENFTKHFEEAMGEYPPMDDTRYYDLECSISDIPHYVEELKTYAPYGEGNPKVLFKVSNIIPDIIDEKHYRIIGKERNHVKMQSQGLGVNLFFLADKFRELEYPMYITCYGSLNENSFRGKTSPELMADDLEKVVQEVPTFQQTLEGLLTI